jgi:hypothetical protein
MWSKGVQTAGTFLKRLDLNLVQPNKARLNRRPPCHPPASAVERGLNASKFIRLTRPRSAVAHYRSSNTGFDKAF